MRGICGVDIDFIVLTVYGEMDGFLGISAINVIGEFDYYRFCHGCIVAGSSTFGQFACNEHQMD